MKNFLSHHLFLTIVTLIAFVSCKGQPQQQKIQSVINISGSESIYPLALKLVNEYQKTHPQVQINIKAGGTGKGLQDLNDKYADIAMASRDLTPAEVKSGLWTINIGGDAVVIIMNKKNKYMKTMITHGFTPKELVEMYVTKTLKGWNSLSTNGDREKNALVLLKRPESSGDGATIAKFLGTRPSLMAGREVNTAQEVLNEVDRNPYAIGFANTATIYDSITRKPKSNIIVMPIDYDRDGDIEDYENNFETIDNLINAIINRKLPGPPARNLYFVSKGKPQRKDIIEFYNWVLGEGQRYVHTSGYVRFKPDYMKSQIQMLNSATQKAAPAAPVSRPPLKPGYKYTY